MNRMVMSLPLALVLLASIGCSKKATPKNEADKHDHGQEAGEARGSHVPLEGIRGLRLMKVAEPRLEGRWVPGEAIGDEAAQALLSSPVKGIVSQILTAPGLTRGEGATLALIQSPELARLKAQWIPARRIWPAKNACFRPAPEPGAIWNPCEAKPTPPRPRKKPPVWA